MPINEETIARMVASWWGCVEREIPDVVTIRGTVRCLAQEVREQIGALICGVARGVAETHGGWGAEVMVGYSATVNTAEAVPVALDAAGQVTAIGACRSDMAPAMASEDFASMLQVRPGAYAWLGVDGGVPSRPLHNAGYDFNDDALPIGAAYWVALIHRILGQGLNAKHEAGPLVSMRGGISA